MDTSLSNTVNASSTSSHSITPSFTGNSICSAGASIGGSIGAIAIATVTLIIVTTINLFANFGRFITSSYGMDYMTITVNINEFISSEAKEKLLNPEEFVIEYDNGDGIKRIVMKEGEHSYLITGLIPNSSFTYNVVCTNPDYSLEYYTETVKIPKFSEPTGIFDELNSYFIYDEYMESALFHYSVYLSDYESKYNNATFYISYSEEKDASNLIDVFYSSDMLNEESYFCGTVEKVINEKIYLYIVGEKNGEKMFLFSHSLDTNLLYKDEEPIEPIEEPTFEISKELESDNSTLNEIIINGKLSKLDENTSFTAQILQYSLNDEIISDSAVTNLLIDLNSMNYTISCGAYYGVAKYNYLIYFSDGIETKVVYESDIKTFNKDQSFSATYTKVSPKDSIITYYENYIDIFVETNFSTTYNDVFRYKLQVTNSNGNVLGEYYGTENALIRVTDYESLDEINFIYYDYAEFMGEKIEYESHAKQDSIQFCIPTLRLAEKLDFNGEYFTLEYYCDMIYDYLLASISFEVSDNNLVYIKTINNILENGVVVFDNILTELGNVSIKGKLNFMDNTTNNIGQNFVETTSEYDMSYNFAITSVIADISNFNYDSSNQLNIPVEIKFDNTFIPNTYLVCITDSQGNVNIETPISDGYCYIDSILSDSDDTLIVTVKDSDGSIWGETYTYNISKSNATANYTEPIMNCVNPYNALVTYNDDGTINIYRKVNFYSDNENIYYNALLLSSDYEYGDDGGYIFNEQYDIIGRDTYAIIENIPATNLYVFNYKMMFDYDGVSYIMYVETPSGSIALSEYYGEAEVLVESENTTITINVYQYGQIENKITVNGKDYSYTSYEGVYEEKPVLILENLEEEITSIQVYFNIYTDSYEDFKNDINVKGNFYKEINLEIIPIIIEA